MGANMVLILDASKRLIRFKYWTSHAHAPGADNIPLRLSSVRDARSTSKKTFLIPSTRFYIVDATGHMRHKTRHFELRTGKQTHDGMEWDWDGDETTPNAQGSMDYIEEEDENETWDGHCT